MQQRIFYILLACLLITAGACQKDDWGKGVETTIAPATQKAPDNNLSLALDPMSNAIVTFEWEPARTGNNTLVFYKVLFAAEGASFSKPIYTGVPAAGGSKTTLALTHRDLNKIANSAGIKALAKGNVQWTIVASNGVVSDTATQPRTLELQRPSGFAENPADLYLSGTATEGGTDVSKAVKFKKLADGVFELWTSLAPGSYKLLDKITGMPLSFVIDGSLIKEGADGNSPAAVKTAYRINLDFNTAVAKLTEIQEVGLWFAGYNKVTNVLTYDAAGVWKAADIAIVWSAQSWGKDERYKFRVIEKDMAGNLTTVFQASAIKDNVRATSTTAASYFFFKSNDASQWDYTYKFEKEAAKADVMVKFQASGDYTHQVVYK